MLARLSIPGLLVTGAESGVGKTVVAGAIANWFARRGAAVAVCKPVGSGCVYRREGLVSEDAELLATWGDARHPLAVICPQRYAERLDVGIAAECAARPVDWEAVQRSIGLMSRDSEVMVLEGPGGVMTPVDEKHTGLDLIRWLGVPTVVVVRSSAAVVNQSLLAVGVLRGAGVRVAGVVVNRYPAESASVAEETGLRAIERWGKVPLLCVVPEERIVPPALAAGIVAAIETVDWGRVVEKVRCRARYCVPRIPSEGHAIACPT